MKQSHNFTHHSEVVDRAAIHSRVWGVGCKDQCHIEDDIEDKKHQALQPE